MIFLAVLAIGLSLAGEAMATSFCSVDPCYSSIQLSNPLPGAIFICPQGDTPTLVEQGLSMSATLIQFGGGAPVGAYPQSMIELRECAGPLSESLSLCEITNADSDSDLDGVVTFTNAVLVGSGCSEVGITVFVQCDLPGDMQWYPMWKLADCQNQLVVLECVAVPVRSPDLTGDGVISGADLATFSLSFPPNAYESCCDMNGDGVVNLQDMATFALHFGPPGHACQ